MINIAKPILFSTPMVVQLPPRGQKTQTRRVIKPQYAERSNGEKIPLDDFSNECDLGLFALYQPGDILWVRETWGAAYTYGDKCNHGKVGMYVYLADGDTLAPTLSMKWRPSIHMPREAARIFLRVTDVRAERLQDISEEDALKEGVPNDWPMDVVYCPICKGEGLIGKLHPVSLGYMEIDCPYCERATERFKKLWDSINAKRDGGKYAWAMNPWVWVYEFERCAKPQGWSAVA